MATYAAPLALCIVFLGILLVAAYRDSERGMWASKPVASLAFIWASLLAGAAGSSYGRWILAGLVLGMAGDLLLIPRGNKRVFRVGILAFLSGHIAYCVAFLGQPLSAAGLLVGGAALGLFCLLVLKWLSRSLTSEMRWPVRIYMIVIAVMTTLACGVTAAGGPLIITVAAIAFTVSDVFVARHRFVTPDFANRALGLPLYYAAQMMLAVSPALI
jgi:uncharacterized membrane protein YhhN